MNTYLLTHWDLDGAVSAIVAKRLYDIKEFKAQGYGKVSRNLDQLISKSEKGIDQLVITDLNLEPQDLMKAVQHFSHVHYYDHHEGSKQYIGIEDKVPNISFHFSESMCGSSIIFLEAKRHFLDVHDLTRMVMLTDIYDMWRTDSLHWQAAWTLNDIFWKYGVFSFVRLFAKGYIAPSEEDWQHCKALEASRNKAMEESIYEQVAADRKICILSNSNILNLISLTHPEEVYYMLYKFDDASASDQYSLSVRVKSDKPYDVNQTVQSLINEPEVISGGGHKLAGGMVVAPDLDLNDIIEFIFDKLDPMMYTIMEGSP